MIFVLINKRQECYSGADGEAAVRKDINDRNDLVALGRGPGVNNGVWRSTWTSKDWTTGCFSRFFMTELDFVLTGKVLSWFSDLVEFLSWLGSVLAACSVLVEICPKRILCWLDSAVLVEFCPGRVLCWLGFVLTGFCPGQILSWLRSVLAMFCPGCVLSWLHSVLAGYYPGWVLPWLGCVLGLLFF